jgi:hypothetical protein
MGSIYYEIDWAVARRGDMTMFCSAHYEATLQRGVRHLEGRYVVKLSSKEGTYFGIRRFRKYKEAEEEILTWLKRAEHVHFR